MICSIMNIKVWQPNRFLSYITLGDEIVEFKDDFFNKVEKKTKVNKDTIIGLAKKLQDGNMKDENTLREVISTLSLMTGKSVSKEQEDKIINTIVSDKVPKNIDKMF